jgi:orotate phosphoribosyltransferase-like protein
MRQDRHLGIRMIAEELNLDKETARQIFNNRFEHEKSVSQNGPKESASFQPQNSYQRWNTIRTHHILTRVAFPFPRIEKFSQRNSFLVN